MMRSIKTRQLEALFGNYSTQARDLFSNVQDFSEIFKAECDVELKYLLFRAVAITNKRNYRCPKSLKKKNLAACAPDSYKTYVSAIIQEIRKVEKVLKFLDY